MTPRFPLTDTDQGAPGFGRPPWDDVLPGSPAEYEDRACCCPAYPVARVVMPPTAERRHSVDLLLCGHHYRVSRQALAAAGARIEDVPGRPGAARAALLETVDRDHAEVR
jgi:hypothetical protein